MDISENTTTKLLYEDANSTYYGGFLPFDFDHCPIKVQVYAEGIRIAGVDPAFEHIWLKRDLFGVALVETSITYAGECHNRAEKYLDAWEFLRENGSDPVPAVSLMVQDPHGIAGVFDVRIAFRNIYWATVFVRHARQALGIDAG